MSGRWIPAVTLVVVGLARAGDARELQQIEVTPFFGYTFSGGLEDADTGADFDIDDSSSYGGIVDLRLSDMTQLEFFFSRQETELQFDGGLFGGQTISDLDVDYCHVGGTYVISGGDWQPFFLGTLGATHLDPDASGGDSETRFSVGLGGGVRFFPLENLGLYLAGRGLFTFVGGSVLFRSESGAATVKIDSDGLWQFQLQAGLIFAF